MTGTGEVEGGLEGLGFMEYGVEGRVDVCNFVDWSHWYRQFIDKKSKHFF